jgi:hypothetical protein
VPDAAMGVRAWRRCRKTPRRYAGTSRLKQSPEFWGSSDPKRMARSAL